MTTGRSGEVSIPSLFVNFLNILVPEPPRASMNPGECRVSGNLNYSNVTGSGDLGQNFTRI